VPAKHSTPSGFRLGLWCNNRRKYRKDGTVSAERIAALDALGFAWDPIREAFEHAVDELAAYVEVHGDAQVSQSHRTASGFRLGSWCTSRRMDRRAGKLSTEQVAALDELGFMWDTRDDAFDRGLAELAAYVAAHGDARVQQKHSTSSGFRLTAWCEHQRRQRKAGRLSAKRIAALDALGFVWDQLQENFDRGLAEFGTYVEVHGDALVPQKHSTPSGFRLGGWCNSRRMDRRAGKLSAERIAALDALGFVWDQLQEDFDRGLAELATYVQAHGDALVPDAYVTTGFKLGTWCGTRRAERRAGKLSAERIAALDALGFAWDPVRETFEHGVDELAAYIEAHGDARVPQQHATASGFRLGGWCTSRRMDRRAGKLSTERIAALDALGFVWDQVQEDFDRGLAEFGAYLGAHGDARVPQSYSTASGFNLGAWCNRRRHDRRNGKLSTERIAALDALGFIWDPIQGAFDRGLGEFATYVQAHGDAWVPDRHRTSSGFRLGTWCGNRRKDRKAGKLSVKRVAALDALGFVWDARQARSDRGPHRVRSGAR
jgi:hypothetical protein